MATSPIPTNLIFGALGVGKTTTIQNLLKQKPDDERWAVLVNEFGEVGIDGSLLAEQGAHIREVPGGCMCCVAGLPMQIGLNRLIHEAQPDRLLIEPTGLGHPHQILQILGNEHYQDVLRLGPVITLVDPRKLDDPRFQDHELFQAQVQAADILVANKTDQCTHQQLNNFERWAAEQLPAKRQYLSTRQGQLQTHWLEGHHGDALLPPPSPHHHGHSHHNHHEPEPLASLQVQPWQVRNNQGQGYFSVGWYIAPEVQFRETELLAWLRQAKVERCKGLLHTSGGWCSINMADGVLSVARLEQAKASRLELINHQQLDAEALDKVLRALSVPN